MQKSALSLPPGIEIYERGWLSANNIFHFGEQDVSIVDTGYYAHSKMTVDLVCRAIQKHGLQTLNKTRSAFSTTIVIKNIIEYT